MMLNLKQKQEQPRADAGFVNQAGKTERNNDETTIRKKSTCCHAVCVNGAAGNGGNQPQPQEPETRPEIQTEKTVSSQAELDAALADGNVLKII